MKTLNLIFVLHLVQYGSANVLGNFLSNLGAQSKKNQDRQGPPIPPGLFYNGTTCGDNMEFSGPSGQIITPGYLEEQEVLGGLDCDWNIKCKKNQAVEISFDYFKLPFTFTQTRLELLRESGLPEEEVDEFLTEYFLLSPDYNLEACGGTGVSILEECGDLDQKDTVIAGPFCNATGPPIGTPIYVSKGNDVTINFKTSPLQGIALAYNFDYYDYMENNGTVEASGHGVVINYNCIPNPNPAPTPAPTCFDRSGTKVCRKLTKTLIKKGCQRRNWIRKNCRKTCKQCK